MNVIIVGGGFCGALVAKKLDNQESLNATLITKRDFYEYTPSVHKLMCHPELKDKIRVPYARFLKNTTVVTDELKRITPKAVETKTKTLEYDYLVIATGIDYPVRLENKENTYPVASGKDALTIAEKLPDAKKILIVGGGLIGVEVAGELATKTKGKEITLVHPKDQLIERNPKKAGAYAKRFLESRGVEFIMNEKVTSHFDKTYITSGHQELEADLGLWCAGIKINPWFMEKFPDNIFTERRALNVNEHLQLEGYPNIFVGGDISSIKEEKTAHNAETHANVIAANIVRAVKGKPLKAHKPHPSPLLISLGDWNCILVYKNWYLGGIIPALMKQFVEWMVLRKYK